MANGLSTDSDESYDPIARFTAARDQQQFIFAVVYRGHWCPFCISHIQSLVVLQPTLEAAGGKPIIITSQTEEHLTEVRGATGYQGEAINDPENILVDHFAELKFVKATISRRDGYEYGMVQPAVLVLKNDGTVLESWAVRPGMHNLGGASDRPELTEVWHNVEAKLNGKKSVFSQYSKRGAFRLIKEKLTSFSTRHMVKA